MISAVDKWVKRQTGARNADELAQYQLARLNATVAYVKERSAFYRPRLENISGPVSNAAEIPFTYPEDIAKFAPQLLCVGQSQIARVVSQRSSGTTGLQKRVFFSAGDQRATVDFFQHGMSEFTAARDTVLILFPGPKEGSIGQLLAEGLIKLQAEPIVYGLVGDFGELLRLLDSREINVIAGLPVQVLELGRRCRANGIAAPGLHSVLLSADHAADSLLRAIEKDLGCRVYQHYGLTETCFGGGVTTPGRDGYHLRHGDFLFEIVDPATGVALPPGAEGEVVFSSLNPGAMPLLRYRTGDVARFLPRINPYPRLDRIKGRLNEGPALRELDEILFANGDIVDFSAVWADDTLEIYVRALRFDAEQIAEYITKHIARSPFPGSLPEKIQIFPATDGQRPLDTMHKRSLMKR